MTRILIACLWLLFATFALASPTGDSFGRVEYRSNGVTHCGSHTCQSLTNGFAYCEHRAKTTCAYECEPGYSLANPDSHRLSCVRTSTDTNNCGSVGHRCSVPEGGEATCSNGHCGTKCPPHTTLSTQKGRKVCVGNFDNDVNHCGRRGHHCPEPYNSVGKAYCKSGECGISCPQHTTVRHRHGHVYCA